MGLLIWMFDVLRVMITIYKVFMIFQGKHCTRKRSFLVGAVYSCDSSDLELCMHTVMYFFLCYGEIVS